MKRSENFNILQLIRRITRHPQKQAVQNDLGKDQSFNAFSAESKKAIKEAGNIEISEIINAEPKWQCKSCLNHCNPGVIYCVCGRLMTTDSAENRKYISSTLDSFSIPCFYIRKDRPRGHRYGKAPGCTEYHTANQLAKKCRKREYESITTGTSVTGPSEGQTSSSSSSWHWHSSWWESDYEYSPQKWYDH